jgi:hypothetical protein
MNSTRRTVDTAPAIQDYQPAVGYYRRTKGAAPRLRPGDAFVAGFFGGLGLWCAGVVIWLGAILLGVLLVAMLGGMGAIARALQ